MFVLGCFKLSTNHSTVYRSRGCSQPITAQYLYHVTCSQPITAQYPGHVTCSLLAPALRAAVQLLPRITTTIVSEHSHVTSSQPITARYTSHVTGLQTTSWLGRKKSTITLEENHELPENRHVTSISQSERSMPGHLTSISQSENSPQFTSYSQKQLVQFLDKGSWDEAAFKKLLISR